MSEFECPRMYKWEENIRNQLRDDVEGYVMEYYRVASTDDLTEEQIDQIQQFIDLPENQFSMVCDALTDIVDWWEPPETE